jgi:ribosomal-protein-alanine N-acetyltransferase
VLLTAFKPIVRPMTDADLTGVSEIERQVSPHPWTYNQFAESLASSHHCWVLEIDNRVAGFFLYSLVSGEAEILDIAIGPNYQGKGLGKLLLEYLIELAEKRAETLFLEVRVSNFSAINLYQNTDFNQVGERRNYYKTANGRENALIFARVLGNPFL